MSPIKSLLVAAMLTLSVQSASASDLVTNGLEFPAAIDFSQASQVVILWRNASGNIEHRDAVIQPLIKQGFEVAVKIELNETTGQQRVSYTLTRSKIQSQEEIQELLSGLVKATRGKGKVSVNVLQSMRL